MTSNHCMTVFEIVFRIQIQSFHDKQCSKDFAQPITQENEVEKQTRNSACANSVRVPMEKFAA